MTALASGAEWTRLGANRIAVRFRLEPDLFWFEGHFPDRPLLPGVAQIDLAIRRGCALLAPDHVFSGVEKAKFQIPLQPGDIVELFLEWRAEQEILEFRYMLDSEDSRRIASSGKIRLCR